MLGLGVLRVHGAPPLLAWVCPPCPGLPFARTVADK